MLLLFLQSHAPMASCKQQWTTAAWCAAEQGEPMLVFHHHFRGLFFAASGR
jgi:hypothetical protein